MDEQSAPQVEIAEDGLSASLALPASFERSTLTPEFCKSLLEEAGIDAEAFNSESLEKFIAQAKADAPGTFEAVIAEATPAVDGIDAYVQWLVDEPASENEPPKPEPDADESGTEVGGESVCFYSRCVFTLVKAGGVLGKVYHEFPGSDGRDVLGKPIPAKPGKPLDMDYDESIQLNEKNQLIAQLDGVLIHDDHLAWVSDTLEVKQNIDFSTGNIDFPGSVVIKQGVKDCFTVKAKDDIEVQGLIEAATLLAGNDLRVMGGFAGRDQGRAEVQGSLYGRYLDAVTTHIAGDLVIDREVINSDSTILGNIISPTGKLIGGRTHVSGTVELQELGANAHPLTELHVGVLPLLDPLIEELSDFVLRGFNQRDELLQEQELITANSGTRIAPSHQAKLREIAREMGRLQLQLDRAEPSLKKITERAEAIRKIDVFIHRRIHPKALLVCGLNRYCVVNEIKGPVRITANARGQLEYRQGDSAPRLLSEEAEFKSAA